MEEVHAVRRGLSSNTHRKLDVLLHARRELGYATRLQPCPACRHDMEQLGVFLDSKIKSIGSATPADERAVRIVKELSYINELINIGILIARILNPVTKLGTFMISPRYETVLRRNREANRMVREHLLSAMLILSKLEKEGGQYDDVSRVLKSFVKAAEFKLNADPVTFFLFDNVIRLFYRLHLLKLAESVAAGVKNAVSCCMSR